VKVWWVVGFVVVPVVEVVLQWALMGPLANFPHLPKANVWPGFPLVALGVLPSSRVVPG
jgi:hypothetical protein